jgi:hypothetical protein
MMKVHLPYADWKLNAAILDDRVLDIQCNHTVTILETILGKTKGWQWHPGVTMWMGHEDFLAQQSFLFYKQWADLGYPDHWTKRLNKLGYFKGHTQPEKPWWWGHKHFHETNKSALLRMNPQWYQQFFVGVPNDLTEWWPAREPGHWRYGPQPQPGGGFDYIIDGKPIYKSVKTMPQEAFVQHANVFHNLMPDLKTGVPENLNDTMREILVALHDRFHKQRVYISHDHS